MINRFMTNWVEPKEQPMSLGDLAATASQVKAKVDSIKKAKADVDARATALEGHAQKVLDACDHVIKTQEADIAEAQAILAGFTNGPPGP